MKKIIQSEDTDNICESDIIRIWEIEQDWWAHGIWEYRKCNDCWHIHSKQDIHGSLPVELYTHTVKEIQKILGNLHIPCQLCSGDTSEIFWEEYIQDIMNRYKNYTSFLTTFRDETGEIQWFLDGYISDFDTIYENEFQSYYGNIWKPTVRKLTEKLLWRSLPDKMLTNSAMCISQQYRSLFVTYDLMKNFYTDLHEKEWNILGIYEASIWSNTHAIYHALGGRSIWISTDPAFSDVIKDTNTDYKSDIGLREDIWAACKDGLGLSLKSFYKQHKGTIKEIIEMGKN